MQPMSLFKHCEQLLKYFFLSQSDGVNPSEKVMTTYQNDFRPLEDQSQLTSRSEVTPSPVFFRHNYKTTNRGYGSPVGSQVNQWNRPGGNQFVWTQVFIRLCILFPSIPLVPFSLPPSTGWAAQILLRQLGVLVVPWERLRPRTRVLLWGGGSRSQTMGLGTWTVRKLCSIWTFTCSLCFWTFITTEVSKQWNTPNQFVAS